MKLCCDRRTMVAMIAMIDMVFGVILLGISTHSLFVGQISKELSNTPSYRLVHLFPLIVNTFQIMISFHLLTSTMQIDAFITLTKTKIWFQGAFITLMCLTLKFAPLFVYLVFIQFTKPDFDGFVPFVSSHVSINFIMVLTLWEMIFKIVSIFLIREYLEELRIEAFNIPNVRFYAAFNPPTTVPEVAPTSMTSTHPPPSSKSFPNWITPTHSYAEKKLGSESIYISNFPTCHRA